MYNPCINKIFKTNVKLKIWSLKFKQNENRKMRLYILY